jgi:5-methylcytosine-specific restriction endonuclease McrA
MSGTYEEYLASDHWQTLRRAAIDYYGEACVLCAATGDGVEVHHRHYKTQGRESLRDLTVLCRPCHKKHHDQPIDDIPFGPPHHDDIAGIRAHFERLIYEEEQA